MYKKLMWWIAVIAWMMIIFSFSAQPANESNELSTGLTRKIIEFIKNFEDTPVILLFGENSVEKMTVLINHIIRKTAHFGIFAVLGILVYGLLTSHNTNRKTIILIAVLICLLYAVGDEIHQYFVPGRACKFSDILIDTAGSFVSIVLVHFTKEKSF